MIPKYLNPLDTKSCQRPKIEAANIIPLLQFRSSSNEESHKRQAQYEYNICEQTKSSKITGYTWNGLKNGSVRRMNNWD